MIRFLTDYTTKALPPEHFDAEQEVTRSDESERYFVQLGVAGYVIDGVLVDQDFKPIVVQTAIVEVIAPGDRRFADGGRAGEVIGVAAPQRASTGPGNDVVFGRGDDTTLNRVEFDQLRSDLAASIQQYEDHRTTTATQIEQLTGDLTTAQGAREEALAGLATARANLSSAQSDLETARSEAQGAKAELDAMQQRAEAAEARAAQLEAELAQTTAPANEGEAAAKPNKSK